MMGILQIGLDIIMEKPILLVSHKLLTKTNLYNLENAEKPPPHALILQNGSDIIQEPILSVRPLVSTHEKKKKRTLHNLQMDDKLPSPYVLKLQNTMT